jgi:hypothetical protein
MPRLRRTPERVSSRSVFLPEERLNSASRQLISCLEELSLVWSGAAHHLKILLTLIETNAPDPAGDVAEEKWTLPSYINSRVGSPSAELPEGPDLVNFNSLFAAEDWGNLPVWSDLPHSVRCHASDCMQADVGPRR